MKNVVKFNAEKIFSHFFSGTTRRRHLRAALGSKVPAEPAASCATNLTPRRIYAHPHRQ